MIISSIIIVYKIKGEITYIYIYLLFEYCFNYNVIRICQIIINNLLYYIKNIIYISMYVFIM